VLSGEWVCSGERETGNGKRLFTALNAQKAKQISISRNSRSTAGVKNISLFQVQDPDKP
jgi:hypothetical protein